MIYNNVAIIAKEIGLGEKGAKELLLNETIVNIFNGSKRRFYYTTDYLIDFSVKRIEQRLGKEFSSNKEALSQANVKAAQAKKHKKTRIIKIGNQKGGVGKTTTALNLATSLAKFGKFTNTRVLLLDLDSQANSSTYFDDEVKTGKSLKSLIDKVFIDYDLTKEEVQEIIFTIELEDYNIDILPSELKLSKAFDNFASRKNNDEVLRKVIDLVKDDYDVIILDTPPNPSLTNENALNIADSVGIAAHATTKSVEGVDVLVDEISVINSSREQNISIDAFFINNYYERREKTRERLSDLQDLAEAIELPSEYIYITKEDKLFGEIESYGLPLIDYKKNLNEALHLNEAYTKYAIRILLDLDK